MSETSLKICTRCILQENVPNIDFDDDGVCNFCRDYEKDEAPHPKDYEELEASMLRVLRAGSKNQRYDALLLFSGGKDSTYILHQLVNKYRLKVLAFTFDNWFIPRETYDNISRVMQKIDAEHVVFKPSWNITQSLFGASFNESDKLETTKQLAFSIGHACWPCFVQIAMNAIRFAVEKNIKNVIIGTTPGQNRQAQTDQVSTAGGLQDLYRSMILPMINLLKLTNQSQALQSLNMPLLHKLRVLRLRLVSFYEFVQYDEDKVYRTVIDELGWKRPKSTDSCSTNCQLNSLGIAVHRAKYGLNPYVIPLARDVREGLVSREDAMKAVQGKLNDGLVDQIATRLNVTFERKPSTRPV